MYPHDIKDNKYAFRKVTIKVKDQSSEASSKEAYENSKKKMEELAKDVQKKAESNNVADVQQNLKSNSRAVAFDTSAIIVLPLPNTFTDTQAHGWSEESGVIGTIGKNLMNMASPGSLAKKAVGAVSKPAGEVAGDIMQGVTADKVLGASASALGLRKPLIDPGYFQNYSGSAPREFVMSWDFVPSNGAEANDIVMIIMKLKEYSSPTKMVNGVSLWAPHFFSIEFGNPFISAMAKIDRVVIKNISIDYGADGFMQQHFDGMPKHISMAVTFAECDMSTADDYNTQRVPQS